MSDFRRGPRKRKLGGRPSIDSVSGANGGNDESKSGKKRRKAGGGTARSYERAGNLFSVGSSGTRKLHDGGPGTKGKSKTRRGGKGRKGGTHDNYDDDNDDDDDEGGVAFASGGASDDSAPVAAVMVTFEELRIGQRVLGIVSEISNNEVAVSLLCGLRGYISRADASDGVHDALAAKVRCVCVFLV